MDKHPKIDRKAIKRPDAFVERGRETLSLIYERRMQILPWLGGAVAIVIGVFAYNALTGHKLDKAWEGYYAASKQTEPQKWDALKKFYQDSSNNRAGYLAAVNLGDHYFDEAKKQWLKGLTPPSAKDAKAPADKAADDAAAKGGPSLGAQAADWYGKAETFAGLLPAEKQLIEVDRGQALEMDKKYDEALVEYQKAVDQGGDAKPFAQLQMARALELKNDRAKAAETYQKIAAESADTEFGKQAKSQLRLLKSPLYQSIQDSGASSGKM